MPFDFYWQRNIVQLLFAIWSVPHLASAEKTCYPPLQLNADSYNNYPNDCTIIMGAVQIDDSSLTEKQLSAKLSTVTSITVVYITNTSVTSLSFLKSLTTITGTLDYPSSFYVGDNDQLKTLDLPLLKNVKPSQTNSIYIEILNSPNLCISKTELNNFLAMKRAYFENIPLCEPDPTYCYNADYSTIPSSCVMYNGDITLLANSTISNTTMDRISSLKTITGNFYIYNTKLTSITLAVETIYNGESYFDPSIYVAANSDLLVFEMPNLKKVTNPNDMDIRILNNNKNLKISETTCKNFYAVSNLTIDNQLCPAPVITTKSTFTATVPSTGTTTTTSPPQEHSPSSSSSFLPIFQISALFLFYVN